jgi:hypothetical protein
MAYPPTSAVHVTDTEDRMPTDHLDAEVRSLMPPPEAKDGVQRLQAWFQKNGAA